jgi:hypothetical protein
VNRIDVVRAALAAAGGSYLELGVRDGACFHAVQAPTMVAVDPRFAFSVPWRSRLARLRRGRTGRLYFPLTSDAFFARHARRLAPFGVVFVDGLHTYDQAHRDVVNALAVLLPRGVVVVHDCNPVTAAAAAPTLEQAARQPGYGGEWNGDVYKAIAHLRTREDLRVHVLDCDHGVGLVTRGAPAERLDLTPAQIEQLTYEDLDADRARLLGLRPPADLDALLDDVRG